MFLKGKAEAFRGFRDVLAEEMVGAGVLGVGEVRGVVEGVVGGGVKEEGEGEGGFKMEEGEG